MYRKTFTILLLTFSLLIIPKKLSAQNVLINEVMSSNSSTIAEDDGDYSDWIELFNPQDTSINLSGYGISDDTDTPFKWIFPIISIPPKNHLLIFASDKNRTEYVNHWETVIDWGDIWKYRLGTSEPPTEWKNLGFDDQTWLSGKSGFGYGDDDDSTIVSAVQSLYVRKIFTIDNLSDVIAAVLHVDFDDGFVAYINGQEIARENIGTVGTPPAYNESTINYTEPLIVYGGKPKAYVIQNIQTLFNEGENVIAIQVHNYGTSSSDLTLIPFLSFGTNTIPSDAKGTNPILDLSNKYLHTNFKLSSEGETLILTGPKGDTSDIITFGTIGSDISLGRKPDGNSSWQYFSKPTPGDSNITEGYSGITDNPTVSFTGGFYSGVLGVTLVSGSNGGVVHYTLDGSEPDENSPIYSSVIPITTTTVLRVIVFNVGMLPSKTITNTYLMNFETTLPVFSLSTNPDNLFNIDYGIYILGDSAETTYPYFGANYWKDWERPVHIEFFENDGTKDGFSMDAGVKIFGAYSRAFDQKSLAIYARGQYGYSSINYPLFKDLPFTEYHSFVLRNAGNDWNSSMFRDGLMSGVVDGIDIDKQDFKPSVVFINGKYWGIHNLREKVSEHFLSQHHNVNPDSIDILEFLGRIVQGDSLDYMSLYSFISNNDLSVESNYSYVKTKMDINNFIRYNVIEIYCANTDWPGNNVKYWRANDKDKWKWILYDTDFGFGLFEANAYKHNTLTFATAIDGPGWPNPPWSTLLLRKLLENESFKNDFINCFADYANTIFKASEVLNKINKIKTTMDDEINRQIERWNPFTYSSWESAVQKLRDFASQRISYLQIYFIQKFGLSGMALLNVAISDTSMGSLEVNSLTIEQPSWSGGYFIGVPLNVIAQPKKGFRFVRWEGSNTSSDDTLSISLNSKYDLTAIFEVDTNYSNPDIVINEINYNSSLSFNTEDWVELYNNSNSDVNLSGWIFKDSDDSHIFSIPQGTMLKKDNYLVLCVDTSLFKPLFSEVENFIGNLDFGLSGSGELIRLYDADMNMMDSLVYDDSAPWPTSPDGNGPTLSLKNPDFDNSLGENWEASSGHGTPGKINDVFTSVEDEQTDKLPNDFALMQNYPNPFNPATKIRYQIPNNADLKNQLVTLKVYDILGNEIIALVNETQNAGYYEVEFNGINLSSGIYFYQLKAGNFVSTKKLVLIK